MSHKVTRHHTNNCYQLKKEIEKLINEGHLKKYVKCDSSNQTLRHGSQVSLGPNHSKEASQGEGSNAIHHTLNTIAEEFAGSG